MGKKAEFSKRGSKSGDTRRLRIYSLHDEQVDVIQAALANARDSSGTVYDSVALTNICMHYLSTSSDLAPEPLPMSTSEET